MLDVFSTELIELDMIRNETDDFMNADLFADKDEDITKVKIADRGRGFVFYPSHFKTYALLKNTNPALAVLFIEDLITYGTTGKHTTSEPTVRALMETIAPVLDRQYAKYLEYCARDKHNLEYYNHPEERYRGSFARLMDNAMKGIDL